MKIKTMGSAAMVAALILSVATSSQAVTVNVFLDDGNAVPGSSNTNWPYAHLARDTTWDVGASAENGLAGIGAAVMEVRMMALGGFSSASSSAVTQGGGTGVGISGGANGAWIETDNAVLFQLSFYEDAAKTTEITGVEISLKSLAPRISAGIHATNMAVNAYASSGVFSWLDNDPAGLGNEDFAYIGTGVTNGGHFLFTANDILEADTSDTGLVATNAGAATDYYTINSDGSVVFGNGDTFWLRRENLNGSPDVAYQLGAVTFNLERPVTVYLDNGSNVPGSSNTSIPYTHLDRDTTWDVTASAENGLSAFGAAVMEVRMMSILDHLSRGAHANGLGMAVAGNQAGANNAWLDNTEAFFLQLRFYSDLAKTTEITDLDVTLKSIVSRMGTEGTNLAVNAYATSRAFSWIDANTNSVIDDPDYANLAPYNMFVNRDGDASESSDTNLVAATIPDFGYHRINSDGSVIFAPGDTFWVRRENLNGAADSVYQLGAVKFAVDYAWNGNIAIEQLSGTNAVGVSWSTVPGKNYRLETKIDLIDAGWSTNTTVTGIGGSVGSVTVTNATDEAQSFYRVIQE